MKSSRSRAYVAKRMKPHWVEQPTRPGGGCGIACLAMLLDLTYVRTKALFPDLCEACGVETDVLDHALASQGYYVRRLHRYREYDGKPEPVWPPPAFAPRHLCLVTQTAADYVQHWIVTDFNHNVFDPADAAYQLCGLDRYHEVVSVAGVWKP